MVDHEELTVDELRDELRDRDLKVSGTKDELIDRLEDHEADGGETADAPVSANGGGGATGGLRQVVERIRGELGEVLGLEVERVTGLARDDEGWRARADVVEVSRIPPSTDVLATYEVTTDAAGSVDSFERVRRFRRSEGEDER